MVSFMVSENSQSKNYLFFYYLYYYLSFTKNILPFLIGLILPVNSI